MGQSITRKYAFMPPLPSYSSSLPNVWIQRPKGDPDHKIPGLFIDPSAHGSPPRRHAVTILYSHGNAEDIGQMVEHLQYISRTARVNIFAYDYPGYGLNLGEQPTESNVNRDETLAFGYLVKERGIDPRSIIIMGRSIGSGPAVYLANYLSKRARPELGCPEPGMFGGLMLQSGVASAVRVVSDAAAHIPFTDIFQNIDLIDAVKAPVCIMHGKVDRVVPFQHGVMLWDKVKPEHKWRFLQLEEADHNDLHIVAQAEWITTIIDFADMVEHTLADAPAAAAAAAPAASATTDDAPATTDDAPDHASEPKAASSLSHDDD